MRATRAQAGNVRVMPGRRSVASKCGLLRWLRCYVVVILTMNVPIFSMGMVVGDE
jgi:hypothetical protein